MVKDEGGADHYFAAHHRIHLTVPQHTYEWKKERIHLLSLNLQICEKKAITIT
jgi:hypothetical protein